MKAIIVLFIAFILGYLLVGGSSSGATISVITKSDVLDQELNKMKDVIGGDLPGYRNHNLRVLSYTLYLLEQSGAPATKEERDVIEFALAYHDVALWTDSKLSYVDPSAERAKAAAVGTRFEKHFPLIHDIVVFHHKVHPRVFCSRSLSFLTFHCNFFRSLRLCILCHVISSLWKPFERLIWSTFRSES